MIFSNGFGVRFDLLYALSMVCAPQPVEGLLEAIEAWEGRV